MQDVDPFMMPAQHFTPDELVLIRDAQFFRTKAVVMTKVRALLDGLYDNLRKEMAEASLLAPPDFDPTKHQFVKGEHLEHCPYQYLDYPKYFAGGTAFTLRSLFWWGHHVVHALLLEGPLLKTYKRNLINRFHSVAGQGLEISLAPSFWEWNRGEGYTLPITHDRKTQIGAIIAERSSLKISRCIPLDQFGAMHAQLPAFGRDTFRLLLPLITA